jgi:hypothetical protein
MPAYFVGALDGYEIAQPRPADNQAAAELINQAFKKSDVAEVCHAIGAANHRSFAGDPNNPNFTTASMFSTQ